MYLSKLRIWNFRRYSMDGESLETAKPGVEVVFKDGLNVLIGENDTGKTTIIDAIKYVLRTQSGEYITLDEKDFHKSAENTKRTTELKIECRFDDLSKADAGAFLEWCDYDASSKKQYLVVRLYAKRVDGRIIQRFGVGENASFQMDWEAREKLRVVYLKPLRDALTDMTHGYKSRLAQILSSLSAFKTAKAKGKKHQLENDYENLKAKVDSYFKESDDGSNILNELNDILTNHFLRKGEKRIANIQLTGSELSDILRQLDLVLETNKSGLGSLNLLCIAAELLLYKEQRNGLKLTLIEELEAHLHPQYQLSLINYIKEQKGIGQFILTTHSTVLGSTIPLENLILVKNGMTFPMGSQYTKMAPSTYKFLERFLEATRANLFFAKGVIIVEGDAENLLIPTIAEIIDRPLHRYGVSIVNVGSTAFKRYVDIFKRKDGKEFGVPVAIITDLDVRALEYYQEKKDKIPQNSDIQINSTELEEKRKEKREKIERENNDGQIKIFLPRQWTLEYEIACSQLYKYLWQAILVAKKEDNKSFNLDKTLLDAQNEIDAKLNANTCCTCETVQPDAQLSYNIFKILNDKEASKAATAQYLADILLRQYEKEKNDDSSNTVKQILQNDPNLQYIVKAIEYVTES